jgi:hypothetical protein
LTEADCIETKRSEASRRSLGFDTPLATQPPSATQPALIPQNVTNILPAEGVCIPQMPFLILIRPGNICYNSSVFKEIQDISLDKTLTTPLYDKRNASLGGASAVFIS